MSLGRFFKVWDTVLDSFALVMLLLVAFLIYPVNPVLAYLCIIAIIDQFDDVYYAIFREHIYPEKWLFKFCSFMLEGVTALVAFGLYVFTAVYSVTFMTPFWIVVHVLCGSLLYSTVRDILREVFNIRRASRGCYRITYA